MDIHDWWTAARKEDGQLKLSSRRLLLVLINAPDKSAFKKACRDGDWSDEEYLVAGYLNELRLLRADNAAISGQRMDVDFILSPKQREEKEADAREKEQIRQNILKQLRGEGRRKLTT